MKNGKYAEIFLTLRGDRACKALSAGEVAAAVRLRWAGFGEGTPQQDLPKGQNRRYADFGTVVESCSVTSAFLLTSVSFTSSTLGRIGKRRF